MRKVVTIVARVRPFALPGLAYEAGKGGSKGRGKAKEARGGAESKEARSGAEAKEAKSGAEAKEPAARKSASAALPSPPLRRSSSPRARDASPAGHPSATAAAESAGAAARPSLRDVSKRVSNMSRPRLSATARRLAAAAEEAHANSSVATTGSKYVPTPKAPPPVIWTALAARHGAASPSGWSDDGGASEAIAKLQSWERYGSGASGFRCNASKAVAPRARGGLGRDVSFKLDWNDVVRYEASAGLASPKELVRSASAPASRSRIPEQLQKAFEQGEKSYLQRVYAAERAERAASIAAPSNATDCIDPLDWTRAHAEPANLAHWVGCEVAIEGKRRQAFLSVEGLPGATVTAQVVGCDNAMGTLLLKVSGSKVVESTKREEFRYLKRSNILPVYQNKAAVGKKDPVLAVTPAQLRFIGMAEPRAWRAVVPSRASWHSYRERV
ncbi:hypothetical protein AB1Y20_009733 [Prymnesium parvum]|uniref:Uncharacterized protein n=1 Tax=Prymnesium parvum TaxID=97485 RepID=A0AB34K4S6_PRYPA